MKNLYVWGALCLFSLSACKQTQEQPEGTVQLIEENGNWKLLRNGEPYYIKGAGGSGKLDLLVKTGGNSIRTWSADNAKEILDHAHENGLTVMMGLWAQHERHGFNYDDTSAVNAQFNKFKKTVEELKDHPALLIWAVGNEVDLNYSNTNVWYAINDIAKMIHELDPNHPVTTVTAGLDSNEVALVKERAPEIDIYSINTYGDIVDVPTDIKKFGWKGPYMITEWGPNGHWEVDTTSWGAPFEQSSKQKATSYRERYQQYIAPEKSHCLGSYVFLWGQKQETTATWYGLLSAEGESSQAVDELAEIWTGSYPENRAPVLDSLVIKGINPEDAVLNVNQQYPVSVFVSDPDEDSLKIKWEVYKESTIVSAGGDPEPELDALNNLFTNQGKIETLLTAPETPGIYRLYVTAYDGHEHYAYANIPFRAIAIK